eukprot:GGOE01008150.1.p1 GENE.GGOE01008150.1~~GGOE01008150.1.p1  ORF type:complete len:210 (+),score=36.53 GGOE01008150.1:439-1068(+)
MPAFGKVDVLNRGLSGYTTRWARDVVGEVCDVTQPVLLTVLLWGANDHVDAESRPQYHVPLEEFRCNLRAIIDHVRCPRSHHPPPKVVVISPPPSARPDRKVDNCIAYAEACREVVERLHDMHHISLLDLTHAMLEQPWEDLLLDGLHFNAAGNAFLHLLLSNHIAAWAPELSPNSLPLAMPHHTVQADQWVARNGPSQGSGTCHQVGT